MNILFHTQVSPFVGHSVGGAETSTKLLATLLSERGHNTHWLSKNQIAAPGFWVKRSTNKQIRLYHYSKLRGEGQFEWFKLFNENRINALIHGICVKHKIDVVYCFYDIEFLRRLLKIRKEKKLTFKIVMRMAGLFWYEQCKETPQLIKNYEDVFNQIDAVNYIHPALEELVVEKFSLLGMQVLFKSIYYGDIGSAAIIARSTPYDALDNPRFEMVMATRFSSYQKRQDILIDAMALIPKHLPIALTLIGNGAEREKIATRIIELGLQDRISIIPFLSQGELWSRLQKADLLCHACDYEGLSKIIIEAMSLGLPVLASNVAPLNAYLTDGINGYLVANTPADWAAKITAIYSLKQQRTAVSDASVAYIEEHYNPQKNVLLYEAFFNNLLNT
jgi:glycosyltransferase involved in cell wall biosynthesis